MAQSPPKRLRRYKVVANITQPLQCKLLNQKVELASESEVEKLFPDCEVGAVPPIGFAYAIQTIWDHASSLGQQDEIYFEYGDHQHLVCITGKQFHELMTSAERREFSHHI